MCQLGQVSRAGWYRQGADPPEDGDLKLRDEIQRIALEWPAYGSRRITAELRRRKWTVNRKRVQRLMRKDNLLCLRKRKFVVTTDSAHGLRVYPNLARQMTLTGIDQLWRADITYVRLAVEFVYLAVILDAYSRRVIGWELDSTMEDSLTLAALRMALSRRTVRPELVHHSDRGVQYASGDYTQLLKDHHIQISMSRKANPWDNAACESFMKTLKHEDAQGRRGVSHRVPRPGRRALAHRRVHRARLQRKASALGAGLLPPGGVRAGAARCSEKGGRCAAAYCMSFPRHREIFPSDEGANLAANAPAHRLDEFPAGYSSVGCSPAEPASASPTDHHFAGSSIRRTMNLHRTASCGLTGCLSRGVHFTRFMAVSSWVASGFW